MPTPPFTFRKTIYQKIKTNYPIVLEILKYLSNSKGNMPKQIATFLLAIVDPTLAFYYSVRTRSSVDYITRSEKKSEIDTSLSKFSNFETTGIL